MSYLFVPDTFNYNLAMDKFLSDEKFIECQIKYKMKFEEFLGRYINFQEVQDCINESNILIPRMKDEDYNFYHKYSNIGSSYLYVRNNYHVENLDEIEIQQILSDDKLEDKFFFDTFRKVIFEEGDSTFFGIPVNETLVSSKSIIFEFAYEQVECKTLKQLNDIKKVIDECFKILNDSVSKKLNTKCSFIIYDRIPDIFYGNVGKKIYKI